MNIRTTQPWLHSARVDSALILAPAFVASVIAWLFRDEFAAFDDMPLWAWVSLVLCIDVAHVYATLFRTYWHPQEFETHRSLLISAPLLVWISGSLLYLIDAMLFWRTLAYLAVFHFIRQQYGFVRLYRRQETDTHFLGLRSAHIDSATVYAVTLYPVIWWHTQLPREFHWFIDGDFLTGLPTFVANTAATIALCSSALFITKEVCLWRINGTINLPKCLLITGTACAWFTGIVACNNDMGFTLTNVVSHGIPYMALVWIYNQRDHRHASTQTHNTLQRAAGFAPAYLLILLALAYGEEGLWDALVWRERSTLFAAFSPLPAVNQHALLALIIPLLTLPQATHYLLDGFIWRRRQARGKPAGMAYSPHA